MPAPDTTVVVPGVTAEMVTCPAPIWMMFNCVPIAIATLAFVGMLKVNADAELMVTRVVASPITTVYEAVCAFTDENRKPD